MIYLIVTLHFFSNFWFYFNHIEDSNTLKQKAAEAYNAHYYSESIKYYDKLLMEYEPNSDPLKLNLAHAHYKAQSYDKAAKLYTELTTSLDPSIRSTAFCQLGLIQHRTKRYKLAIYYFKEALRVNPNNKIAAYNFEFLKITLQKEEHENSPNGNGAGTSTDSKNNSTGNDTKTENTFDTNGNNQSSIYFRMLYEQKRLSKQQAEKLLEYIQEQEMQYYHQIKKHVPKNPNKPDW